MLKECVNLWKFYRFCLWCGNKTKADEIEKRLLKISDKNKFIYYIGKLISLIK